MIGSLLSRATEAAALIDIGTGPLTELLCEHGALFVDRVEALAWSSPAFAQALENVWLPEADSDVARWCCGPSAPSQGRRERREPSATRRR